MVANSIIVPIDVDDQNLYVTQHDFFHFAQYNLGLTRHERILIPQKLLKQTYLR